jgi:hypothetical protein
MRRVAKKTNLISRCRFNPKILANFLDFLFATTKPIYDKNKPEEMPRDDISVGIDEIREEDLDEDEALEDAYEEALEK